MAFMSPISQFHFAENWPQAENEKKKVFFMYFKEEKRKQPIKAISQFY